MLSYEHCQKLKESGFPQEIPQYWEDDVQRLYDYVGPLYYHEQGSLMTGNPGGTMKDWYFCPTLEELIRELGDQIRGLEVGDWLAEDKSVIWYAKSKSGIIVDGHTPEEALVNLYLAIHDL